jgi:oligopeptide transport system substrate-binding protein
MKIRLHFVVILVSVILLVIPTGTNTFARQSEPVTLYDSVLTDDALPLEALDPHKGYFGEDLFLGLTNVDPASGSIIPELAIGWEVSDEGRVWTFTLRDDVSWVRWDPATGEATLLRTVTAHDVVYGIQRACDPRTDAGYRFVIEGLITGCRALATRPVHQVTDADYDLVQARALDDTTLEIHLQHAAGYFLTLSGNPLLRALPREVIEEYGNDWTQPGTIVTNGPFVLDEWRDGWGWTLGRNPYLPADVRGPGNVERVVITHMDSYEAAFQAYMTNQLDLALVPPQRYEELWDDSTLADQINYYYRAASNYYAFASDKAPFDNVHVRRAFSAALDREQWCSDIYGVHSSCAPMIHFTPPGVFGAPPIDEVGVGFDPDYAREQLALAGYPECKGFPEIHAVTEEGLGFIFTYLADQLADVLGCDPGLWHVEEVANDISRADPRAPEEDRPHMWINAWIADYPDANSFMSDVLYCNTWNEFKRPCTEVDDLIDQAAAASDPLVRNDLYRDIEERFFGPEGEFPIIPVHTGILWLLAKPWVERSPGGMRWAGSLYYDWYTIDQAAQVAARGE